MRGGRRLLLGGRGEGGGGEEEEAECAAAASCGRGRGGGGGSTGRTAAARETLVKSRFVYR